MSEKRCSIHGEVIVHEEGGPTMPTIHGRDYCPTCQEEVFAALDDDELDRGSLGIRRWLKYQDRKEAREKGNQP